MGHFLCIIMSKNFGKKFRESAVRRKLKYWFSKKNTKSDSRLICQVQGDRKRS